MQSDPEGGIPSGSLEVLGRLEANSAGAGLAVEGDHADLRWDSCCCNRPPAGARTSPELRWARGTVFWADSEASVQIAPSGMMKKRKDGFIIFEPLFCIALFGVGDYRCSRRIFPPDVVHCFICFAGGASSDLYLQPKSSQCIEFVVIYLTPPSCRRRRPGAGWRAACGHRTSGSSPCSAGSR